MKNGNHTTRTLHVDGSCFRAREKFLVPTNPHHRITSETISTVIASIFSIPEMTDKLKSHFFVNKTSILNLEHIQFLIPMIGDCRIRIRIKLNLNKKAL